MQSCFRMCIFCWKPLPEPRERGRGDHIIPEYLHGSITSKDVCEGCNKRLGAIVDKDILFDARLLPTVDQLGLDRIRSRILEQSHAVVQDDLTERQFQARHKNGEVRIVPCFEDPGPWTLPERDAESILISKLTAESWDDDVASDIQQLFQRFRSIPLGDEVSDEKLKLRIRKAQGRVLYTPKFHSDGGKRLAAKIVYEFSFYAITPEILRRISKSLSSLCRYIEGINAAPPWTIMYPNRGESPSSPDYSHQLIFRPENFGIQVDVHLFGNVSYRILLILDEGQQIPPILHENRTVSEIGIAMSFQPGRPKTKHYALRYEDADVFAEFPANRL